MSKVRVNTSLDETLIGDIEILAAEEPLMAGRAMDRRTSPYIELVLRRHRDANEKKLTLLKKKLKK